MLGTNLVKFNAVFTYYQKLFICIICMSLCGPIFSVSSSEFDIRKLLIVMSAQGGVLTTCACHIFGSEI